MVDLWTTLLPLVIGSAVVPTMIANAAFLPTHLIPTPEDTSRIAAPPTWAPTGSRAADQPLEEG